MLMYSLNLQDRTVRSQKLPWSRSTTVDNTLWSQSIKIWLILSNIKWFQDVSTIHYHYATSHCYVPSWYWNTTQMFTLWKVKKKKFRCSYFFPWPNPITPSAPISHSPERSHFNGPLPSTPSCSYPGTSSRIKTASVLSIVSRAGGRCMMGVVGKAERQRERRVHEDKAAASHDFTAWVLFPCLQV